MEIDLLAQAHQEGITFTHLMLWREINDLKEKMLVETGIKDVNDQELGFRLCPSIKLSELRHVLGVARLPLKELRELQNILGFIINSRYLIFNGVD